MLVCFPVTGYVQDRFVHSSAFKYCAFNIYPTAPALDNSTVMELTIKAARAEQFEEPTRCTSRTLS